MGYDRYGNRYGRERDQGDEAGRSGERSYRGGDDRGFFDRARDEVSSWFSGDEDGARDRPSRDDEDMPPRGRRPYGIDRDFGRDGAPMTGDYGRPGGGFRDRPQDAGSRYGSQTGERSRYGAQGRDQRHFDPHYQSWRQEQIDALDRDYDEYRREHQSKFENDFGAWRTTRQSQREAVRQMRGDMEVVGSDGEHVGKVDHVRGDRILLAGNDEAAGGRHHSIPCAWVQGVGEKVMLNKSGEEARRAWTDADQSRALGERENRDSSGPHVLDRSFAGTYDN